MKKVLFAIILCIILSISAFASQPSVVDALHYVKDVITVDYALEMGIEQGAFGKHSVVIPKINIDTPTAQKINREMYVFGGGAYELLLKNQEDNMIYNYGYFYKEECGVIGIILTKIGGIQCGGGSSDYKAFYYDTRTDEQLSFKEYLSALGVDINDLSSNSVVKKAYKNAGQDGSIVVLDAILDSKSSAVYVKTPMSMSASMIIKSDTPLVNIEIKDPFALYTGKANEIVMTLGSKTAYVSGNEVGIDAEPIISNGRTMLPARFVAEKLGATVDWDALSRKVIIKKDALKIELIVNSSVAYVNGREVALDSPVFIQNGRTYTPVRFVAEKLGAVVEWLGKTRQVVISKDTSIETILTEYYYNNKEAILEKIGVSLSSVFLADLDYDCSPELCLNWGNGGYNSWLWIYKYKNGQVEEVDTINSGHGMGISSGFDLVLQKSGDILICEEHGSWSPMDGSFGAFSYIEYNWGEEKNTEKYKAVVSPAADDKISIVENGIKTIVSESELYNVLDEIRNRKKYSTKNSLDLENLTFNSVWKKQVQIYNN